jgi:hypothetical protein
VAHSTCKTCARPFRRGGACARCHPHRVCRRCRKGKYGDGPLCSRCRVNDGQRHTGKLRDVMLARPPGWRERIERLCERAAMGLDLFVEGEGGR